MKDLKNKNYIHELAAISMLIILAAVLAIRCQFSFCQSDESFYMALVDRFYVGETPFINEWHPSQLFAFAIYPLYALFMAVVPSGEGLYLAARYAQLLINLVAAFCVYFTLKRRVPPLFSALCAAFILLYARENISTLNYYNLYTCFCTVSIVCVTAQYRKSAQGKNKTVPSLMMLSGLMTALAVLCMPYLAVPVILCLLFGFIRNKKYSLYFCAGILVAAVPVIVRLLSSAPLSELINAVTNYVLNDPEHQGGALRNLQLLYRAFIEKCWLILLPLLLSCVLAVLKHKGMAGERLFIISQVLLLCSIAFCFLGYPAHIDLLYMYVTVFSLPFVISLALDKKLDYCALFFYVCGILLTAVFSCGSNTALTCLGTGMVISSVGGMMSIYNYCSTYYKNKFLRAVPYIIAAGFITMMLLVRIVFVYRDAQLFELNARITRGPAAGLYTTQEHRQQYDEVCAMLDEIMAEYPDKNINILYSNLLPWAYIYTNYGYGTPSSWRAPISSPRLEEYYAYAPDKIPDIVVVFDEDIGSYQSDSKPNSNDLSGRFYEYIQNMQYEVKTMSCAEVYVSPPLA